ncbi:DUF4349 domain-containing protein [Pontibacillus yanchengensis]|uniref:DUF4349 domain-containing protein n=2 Tax=Pontibacillus yanchengensis TaxID=462910 RepID=A0ACC7VF81_9BACI|nr:DUF4349 domain-containing protein [Pontibacillus yanchengensis]MYL32269.1 DUF4349 domain-containing protein [Pontibacillus yanchengensis]MYL52849.1 DUF4349 domain-containing protein [Pontibacillus yanchengensis]
MKMRFLLYVLLGITLVVSACSNNEGGDASKSENSESANTAEGSKESANTDAQQESSTGNPEKQESSSQSETNGVADVSQDEQVDITNQDKKMIIYNADISIKTREYNPFYQKLEQLIQKHKGYIVNSSVNKGDNEKTNATVKLRVPKENFYPFVNGLSPISGSITNKDISGRDVTEDYVDLESRLKAKQKVEERLLSFMDQAEETEQLLQVSKDLERVQEEIEVIQGKMNYLENQSDYSTVTLHIQETKVVVSNSESNDLQTWTKTKQAFHQSVDGLQKFLSFLTVALIGYSPIIILLLLVVGSIIGLRIWRKKRQQINDSD